MPTSCCWSTVFIVLAMIGESPVWLSVVVVARDVVIGVGALSFKWLFGPLNGRATAISKVNTGVQLIYVLALVAHLGLGFPTTIGRDHAGRELCS